MTTAPTRRATLHRPDLRVEKQLLRGGCTRLAAMDEVGRGALAGPVSVGVVVVTASIGRVPLGLRDSKLLTPAARDRLVAPVRRWAIEWAVGHAWPEEIDAYGIMAGLRMAARRALAQLSGPVDAVLLDGNHDYLNAPAQATLFESRGMGDADEVGPAMGVTADEVGPAMGVTGDEVSPVMAVTGGLADRGMPVTGDEFSPRLVVTGGGEPPAMSVTDSWPASSATCRAVDADPVLPVHLRVKADLRCAGVAAASVLAKTTRDAMMIDYSSSYPAYGWAVNKGYATPEHLAAIAEHGPCDKHRRSWRLSGPLPADSVGEDE